MQCSSCGATVNNSTKCEECGEAWNAQNERRAAADHEEAHNLDTHSESQDQSSAQTEVKQAAQASRLIEFPGVSRNSVPGWRKEIAERVREAQERRAREAAAEAVNHSAEAEKQTPQLELLPQAEAQQINPLVAAALKRIERAHIDPANGMDHGRPLAAACASDGGYQPLIESPERGSLAHATSDTLDGLTNKLGRNESVDAQENSGRSHNLVVVSPTTAEDRSEITSRRSRKLISDDLNNPALNYLDTVPTTVRVEDATNNAPPLPRLVGGLLDLLILACLCSPFVAIIEIAGADWSNPIIIVFTVATVILVGFLYSTVCTALTGRTLGMRLLNLRVVDARTGLIPTGSQSAGRALLYLLSLLSVGILFATALIDSDQRAVHDRFTKTAVITS